MLKALGRVVSYAWDNLGNCSFCIRAAFRAAAAGWGVTLLVAALGWPAILTLAIIGATALTVLWAAHLLVHARKIILAESLEVVQPEVLVSRRATFPLFIRTVCAAAVMSAAPALADHVECPNGVGACGNNCGPCYRPCYGGPTTPCVRCRSCGNDCGDHVC